MDVVTLTVKSADSGGTIDVNMDRGVVGETDKFRIYIGVSHGLSGDQPVILKVAQNPSGNDLLAAESGRISRLNAFADEITEIETGKVESEKSRPDLLVAVLVHSYVDTSQLGHRINVFTTPEVGPGGLVALAELYERVEIDPRTSVWILGRLFKFYSIFEMIAERERTRKDARPMYEYPLFSPGDYLIGPWRHRVIYYNYSEGALGYYLDATDFVKVMSKYILEWTVFGSDDKTYREMLSDLAEHGRSTFKEAHADFYQLVEELWGVKYHPFTYRYRGEAEWKTMREE